MSAEWDWKSLGMRCPRCLGALNTTLEWLECVACTAIFPVLYGIPDLRTGQDPYLTKAQDLTAATALAARAESTDFRSLLASYYETNDKVPPSQVALFTQGTIAAGERAERTLAAWERLDAQEAAPHRAAGTLLDVGCGTAPLAIAAARRGWRAIGLDVGLRWLVLAKKRAQEAGVAIPLVCANVEVLPFSDGVVSRAGGESILENARDADQALHELARVLGHGGRLWLTTPNKRSLGPDPHLGVMAGGWWPEKWLRRHAERAGKVYPSRRLYTPGSLRRSLEAADFEHVTIELPDVSAAQKSSQGLVMRAAIGAYQFIKRVPVAGRMLRSIAPTYLVTATRT